MKSLSLVPASKVHSRLLLVGMSLAVFLTVTAVAMLGPLLVDMSSALGTTVPVTGQLVTIAGAIWFLSAIVAGPYSDAYGRKPVLLLGTSLLAIGTLGIGLTPNYIAAAGFSALVGAGGGMVPPTCIALIGDIFSQERRPTAIAMLTSMPGVSSVLGVPLSAFVGDFAGWRVPFVSLGLALFLAFLLLFAIVPRRASQRTRLELTGRLSRVASLPFTWHIAAVNLMARVTWGVVLTFFPAFLIITYGLRTGEVALPVAIVALGATAGPLLGGKIGRGRKRFAITAGLLVVAVIPGLALFLVSNGTWHSIITASFFMLLVVPVSTILSILFAEIGGTSRGTLAGVISSTNWGGTAAGAALGGILVAQAGFGGLSFLIVGAILGSALLMVLLVNDRAAAHAQVQFSAPLRGDSTNNNCSND